MTTARKVLLIIATALVAAGVVIAGSAFALAGGDIRSLSTDQREWEMHTYEIPADEAALISSIEVSDDTEDVRIEGYDGDAIRIEYWDHQQRGVSITQEDGALLIGADTVDEIGLIGFFVSYPDDHALRISVPHDFAGSIFASADEGNASAVGFGNLGPTVIESRNGMAIANSLRAKTLRMESENGSLQCDIVTVDGTLQADAGNGDISLDSTLADIVAVSSGNGNVSAAGVTARTSIQVGTQNGSADLYYTDAPETIATSENGDVTLSLPGDQKDYRVQSSATNGFVEGLTGSASDDTATRTVTARTTNGNVEITYDLLDLDEPGRLYDGSALEQLIGRWSALDQSSVAGE